MRRWLAKKCASICYRLRMSPQLSQAMRVEDSEQLQRKPSEKTVGDSALTAELRWLSAAAGNIHGAVKIFGYSSLFSVYSYR